MSGVRKTIAVLMLIFIGVPVLIGVIWAVGLTRAVVSPEFLSEMPQDIISKVPVLLEETLEAVDREDVIHDEDARAWVRAIANAETSPRELLEKIGIMDWLRNQVTQSLEDVGKILRGEMGARPVMLNMRPLKAALNHEVLEEYLMELLKKLPPCTDDQVKEWVEEAIHEVPFEDKAPPACRPSDMVKAVQILRQAWTDEVKEIPDEIDILNLENEDFFPRKGVNISRLVVTLTYFLFFFPAVLLLLSAIIATSSGNGILRWIGIPTLVGGVLAFGLSKFIGKMVQWGVEIGPFNYSYSEIGRVPFSEVGEIFIEKMGDIILVVFDHLFSAVNTVAGVVCIVGVVLIALSYLVTRETGSTSGTPQRTAAPAAAASAVPAAPAVPPAPPAPAAPALPDTPDPGTKE